MKEYIQKHIFSDSLTTDDIKQGRTGLKHWDSLE
jgi:hypothetical protein